MFQFSRCFDLALNSNPWGHNIITFIKLFACLNQTLFSLQVWPDMYFAMYS